MLRVVNSAHMFLRFIFAGVGVSQDMGRTSRQNRMERPIRASTRLEHGDARTAGRVALGRIGDTMADTKDDKKSSGATFKKGDNVEWDSSQGEIKGEVVRKLTEETQIKGHTAKASKGDPQYLVKSDKTGSEAAHKPDELRKA